MRFLIALAAVSTAVLVAAPVASPVAPTKVERRAALEAAVVHEMNRVRDARGLRPAPRRAEPALGRAQPLAGDAARRLLQPRLG